MGAMGNAVEIWGPESGAPHRVNAVVSPTEAGSNLRVGGRAEAGSMEVELDALDVAALGVEEGWRVRIAGRDHRMNLLTFQGGTVTAVCGPVGGEQG